MRISRGARQIDGRTGGCAPPLSESFWFDGSELPIMRSGRKPFTTLRVVLPRTLTYGECDRDSDCGPHEEACPQAAREQSILGEADKVGVVRVHVRQLHVDRELHLRTHSQSHISEQIHS